MRFFALILLAGAVTVFMRLPLQLAFQAIAFGDPGLELVAEHENILGRIPDRDFGWIYGLLPLLVGKLWYAVAGVSPESFFAVSLVCQATFLFGVAQVARVAQFGVLARTMLLVSCPFWLPRGGMTLVHEIEPVLLVWALAFQLAGQPRWALCLTACCVFVKPSMAVVFSTLLVGQILFLPTTIARSRTRELLPAGCCVVGAAALLAWIFGADALVASLYPAQAAEIYRENNFGFFRAGRSFWLPEPLEARYYLTRSVAGTWLILTAWVTVAAALALASCKRFPSERRAAIVSLTAMHLAFIFLFFGNEHSYTYYFYLLVLAGGLARVGRWQPILLVITLWFLGLVIRQAAVARVHWAERHPDGVTFGLWATNDVRTEWAEVLARTSSGKTAILSASEGVTLLTDHFGPPGLSFADVGWNTREQLDAKRNDLRSAAFLVVPLEFQTRFHDRERSPLREELRAFVPVWTGRHFGVFQQPSPRE